MLWRPFSLLSMRLMFSRKLHGNGRALYCHHELSDSKTLMIKRKKVNDDDDDEDDDTTSYVLLPYVDMLNHSVDGIWDFGPETSKDSFVFRAHRDIKCGEAVHLQYSRNPMWRMWKAYGFVPESALGALEPMPLPITLPAVLGTTAAFDSVVSSTIRQWLRDPAVLHDCRVFRNGTPNSNLLALLRLLHLGLEEVDATGRIFKGQVLSLRNECAAYFQLYMEIETTIEAFGPKTDSVVSPAARAINDYDRLTLDAALAATQTELLKLHNRATVGPTPDHSATTDPSATPSCDTSLLVSPPLGCVASGPCEGVSPANRCEQNSSGGVGRRKGGSWTVSNFEDREADVLAVLLRDGLEDVMETVVWKSE
eukprot:PhM_4_TR18092/c1_g3_i1/m.49247